MALQVWLPLNGDLHNQGLNQNVTLSAVGNPTIENDGKIGKCYAFDGSSYFQSQENFLTGMTECSLACWVKDTYTGNSWMRIFGIGEHTRVHLDTNGAAGQVRFFVSKDGSTGQYWGPIGKTNLKDSTWHHICGTFNSQYCKIYIDGKCEATVNTGSLPTATGGKLYLAHVANGVKLNGSLNDIRVYDHALSPKEVEDISKALVLHYPLNDSLINPNNLFAGTAFTPEDTANFSTPSPTNLKNYLCFYNGTAGLHTFKDGEDTIKLSTKGNIGICFVRKASEIGLSPNKYYTISCEAKCSQANAQFSIGLSYYKSDNTGVWHGGDNKKSFTDVDTWQTFTLTFKPDANTNIICYCFTVYGTNGGTDTFSIRHCKLEEGRSATSWFNDTIYDSSGYGNNGTIVGSASAAAGSPRYNNVTYMNNTGTANHIECDKVITIPTDGITVSFWAYTDKTNSYVLYIDQNMSFAVSSGGTAFYVCRTSSAGFPKTEFKTGQWNHVVLIRNGDTYKAYINGKSIARNQSNNNWTHQVANIYLFNRKYNNSYAANAYMSDFRIYATELTEDQIQELYQTSMLVDASGNIIPRGLED